MSAGTPPNIAPITKQAKAIPMAPPAAAAAVPSSLSPLSLATVDPAAKPDPLVLDSGMIAPAAAGLGAGVLGSAAGAGDTDTLLLLLLLLLLLSLAS